MSKTTRFLIEKAVAIAIILIGLHFMVSHFCKVLPFGWETENIGIWFIWAYAGWFFGAIMVVGGGFMLFKRTINRYIEKSMR